MDELDTFEEVSNAIDLILVVPIFVFAIALVEVLLIDATLTQCKSTVDKLLIGKEPKCFVV